MILLETNKIYKDVGYGPESPHEEGDFLVCVYDDSGIMMHPSDYDSQLFYANVIKSDLGEWNLSKKPVIVNFEDCRFCESEREYEAFIEHGVPLFTKEKIKEVEITRVPGGYILSGTYIPLKTY